MSPFTTIRTRSFVRCLLLGAVLTASANATKIPVGNNAATEKLSQSSSDILQHLSKRHQRELIGAYSKASSRIVGGETVPDGAYPFFAQWMKGCGGSLVHDDIVLTAGHCLDSMKALWFDVYIGGHKSGTGYKRTIIDHVRHYRYDFDKNKAYDFLLLKLNKPIENIDESKLVKLNPDPSYPREDEVFTVIGFGYTDEDEEQSASHLQHVEVPHIADCNQYYPDEVDSKVAFCAGHHNGEKDACQADSGGALLNPETNVQVGLVSWGRGCAREQSPGVYARVSTAYSWIQHHICEISAVPPADCTAIRVDIQMDPETAWLLMDDNDQEVAFFKRGTVPQSGKVTSILNLKPGQYYIYVSDNDGIAPHTSITTSSNEPALLVYEGKLNDTNGKLIARHNGQFQGYAIVKFTVGGNWLAENPEVVEEAEVDNQDTSTTTTGEEGENTTTTKEDEVTTAPEDNETTGTMEEEEATTPEENETTITTEEDKATISKATNVENNTSTTSTSTTNGKFVPNPDLSPNSPYVFTSYVRVEITYDARPMETGWFLANSDTNVDIYASTYNSDRLVPEHANYTLSTVVKNFSLEPGNYWFVVADSAANGMCCNYGHGRVRLIYVSMFEPNLANAPVEAARNSNATTSGTLQFLLEEHVLWEHDGQFTTFAEFHFTL